MARLLLIEDDELTRRALRLTLEKAGHEVMEAGNGHQGLAVFQSEAVDLVITDMILPEMDGLETIRALKALRADLAIIAISGGGRGTPESYLRLAKGFGASRIFAKPFEPADLRDAIDQLLGKKAPPAPPDRA